LEWVWYKLDGITLLMLGLLRGTSGCCNFGQGAWLDLLDLLVPTFLVRILLAEMRNDNHW